MDPALRRLFLTAALLVSFAVAAAADPGIALRRGTYRGAQYACVVVDPRTTTVDLACFGRHGNAWTPACAGVGELGPTVRAALNGTFFSLKYHEPAGLLVYDDGHKAWQPRFKRLYGGRDVAVVTLPRHYLAVFADGRVAVGNSEGRGVAAVQRALERDGRRLRCLMGGCGLLVAGGRRAMTAATLAREGFDERSGLNPPARVPRSAIGVTADGRLLLLAAGHGGTGLSLDDTGDLLASLGARDGLFVDCGGSTQLRCGRFQVDAGRPLPTWIVVR